MTSTNDGNDTGSAASAPATTATNEGGPLDGPDLTTPAASEGRASAFSLDVERRGIADGLRGYVNKIRSGEPGALPSILGLVVLGVIFSQVSSDFLSKGNIGNLPGQGAYIAIIALGLVFVLLLGEIDLSAGTTGGICAAFAAQAIVSGGLRGGIPGSNLLFGIMLGLMILALVLGVWLRSWLGLPRSPSA